jgi:hypothetical protein
MDGEFRTKGAIMSQFQKNVLFIGAEVIVVMRKLSIISVLLPLIWVLINPGAVLASDAADAAVGNCIDDHIATGRYFVIDLTTGRLDVQKSSLKLVTTCQGPVSAWINLCEKESGNSYSCTQGAMRVTQMLLLDGWNHRSDLRKWRSRPSAQPGSGVTFIAPRTQRARTESAANPQQAEEAKPSTAQPEVPNEQKQVSAQNPNPPAQPPDTDQQAIALWNQKRYSDAVPIFDQACSDGKADSCYHLGLIYDFGLGVTQEFSRASAFYTKSCNAGNGAACYHLGMLPQSQPGGCNSRAVMLNLSRSCDMGIATSCSMVGYSYIHGCGVAKDTEKGRQLLSRGCSLGDHNACDGIN